MRRFFLFTCLLIFHGQTGATCATQLRAHATPEAFHSWHQLPETLNDVRVATIIVRINTANPLVIARARALFNATTMLTHHEEFASDGPGTGPEANAEGDGSHIFLIEGLHSALMQLWVELGLIVPSEQLAYEPLIVQSNVRTYRIPEINEVFEYKPGQVSAALEHRVMATGPAFFIKGPQRKISYVALPVDFALLDLAATLDFRFEFKIVNVKTMFARFNQVQHYLESNPRLVVQFGEYLIFSTGPLEELEAIEFVPTGGDLKTTPTLAPSLRKELLKHLAYYNLTDARDARERIKATGTRGPQGLMTKLWDRFQPPRAPRPAKVKPTPLVVRPPAPVPVAPTVPEVFTGTKHLSLETARLIMTKFEDFGRVRGDELHRTLVKVAGRLNPDLDANALFAELGRQKIKKTDGDLILGGAPTAAALDRLESVWRWLEGLAQIEGRRGAIDTEAVRVLDDHLHGRVEPKPAKSTRAWGRAKPG